VAVEGAPFTKKLMEKLRWGYDFSKFHTPFFIPTGGKLFLKKNAYFPCRASIEPGKKSKVVK